MSQTKTTTDSFWGEPISVYTRSQAIEDGVLVDVSEWARETGFRAPVVMTRALWTDVDADSLAFKSPGESTRGRAHDVLFLAALALKGALRRDDYLAEFRATLGPLTHTLRVSIDGDGVCIGHPEDF